MNICIFVHFAQLFMGLIWGLYLVLILAGAGVQGVGVAVGLCTFAVGFSPAPVGFLATPSVSPFWSAFSPQPHSSKFF